MPSSQTCESDAQCRQEDAERQHRLLICCESEAEIGAQHRQQNDGKNEMSPAGRPRANAWHKQQFNRAGKARKKANEKASPDRPEGCARPKGVACPPIENVSAERTHCEGYGKRYQHGVQRMARNRNSSISVVEYMRCVKRIEVPFFVGVRRSHFSLLLVSATALAGCSGPLSTLDPAGSAARDTLTLFNVLLLLAGVSFLVIFGLFLLAFRRHRERRVSLRLFLVGGGLVFPLTLLSIVTVYGVVLGERISGAQAPVAVSVEAQAERWRWRFTRQTPAGSRSVIDRLDIPAGQPVEITVTSVDVIHSFWAPRLGGKVDAIPGVTNRIILRADAPGRYAGLCAEFCGPGHSSMSMTVVAHDAKSWAALESGAEQ
jgi:heme/copper-type cytochrome/quinol oxidase subunit 2